MSLGAAWFAAIATLVGQTAGTPPDGPRLAGAGQGAAAILSTQTSTAAETTGPRTSGTQTAPSLRANNPANRSAAGTTPAAAPTDPRSRRGRAGNRGTKTNPSTAAPSVERATPDQSTGRPTGQSPSDALATSPAASQTSTASRRQFIKGNLIHLGTRELVSRFDHVGVRFGPHIIDKDLFLGVTPSAAFYGEAWSFGFQVPINLLMLSGGSFDFGGAKIRRRDWDELSDYPRLIRFITYGRKESPIYFTISSLRPTTLGHGELIHNYQPSIDVDRSMTGLVLEGHNGWAGFQFNLNDITFQNNVIGGLFFVRPMAWAPSLLLSSLSFGLEYAADFSAPKCISRSETDRTCIPGSGNLAGFDPLTGAPRDDTFVRTDTERGRPVVQRTAVHAIGLSAEAKFVKTEDADVKLFATAHQFIDHGNGFAAGFLGRFNLGDRRVSAFRTRLEARTFSAGFLPAYFDTLYEITKYQSLQAQPTHQVTPTRYQRIFGDPENGFTLSDTDQRLGFNAELSWALFAGSRSAKKIAVGIGLADSTGPDDTNFYVHAEIPFLEVIQFFASFLRVNAPDVAGIVDPSFDNVVILAGIRSQLFPFLFLNAHYSRAFQIVRSAGQEFHLGNETVVDEAGARSPYFSTDRIYENVQTLFVELEIGWEFRP